MGTSLALCVVYGWILTGKREIHAFLVRLIGQEKDEVVKMSRLGALTDGALWDLCEELSTPELTIEMVRTGRHEEALVVGVKPEPKTTLGDDWWYQTMSFDVKCPSEKFDIHPLKDILPTTPPELVVASYISV